MENTSLDSEYWPSTDYFYYEIISSLELHVSCVQWRIWTRESPYLQPQEMETCFLSQRPFIVEFLVPDHTVFLQTQSLEISILLILTCTVIDTLVLCVLIKCYYLLLCPEAIYWEWVRFHKSHRVHVESLLTLLAMSLWLFLLDPWRNSDVFTSERRLLSIYLPPCCKCIQHFSKPHPPLIKKKTDFFFLFSELVLSLGAATSLRVTPTWELQFDVLSWECSSCLLLSPPPFGFPLLPALHSRHWTTVNSKLLDAYVVKDVIFIMSLYPCVCIACLMLDAHELTQIEERGRNLHISQV